MDDMTDMALTFDDIKQGVAIAGIMPDQSVTVVAAMPLGDDAINLFYTTADGGTGSEIIDSAATTCSFNEQWYRYWD
ncbi:hypothetical protein BTIS_1890 [Bifidobacterium tissieri]|uniref:Uncharacterized protein n=2 Tax=Bifidobacterium TaxID=1678 RepID=A0A261F9K2_9BIFI|nr:hypothetical protein [Bifidobacterium tissieri]OZG55663.1 hypothetical protein BTIS_1890 [Bifidobacterium tissieri]TPF96303.1 hypothetical protein EP30_08285 [Bifidobacterium sp. UTCIF-39]